MIGQETREIERKVIAILKVLSDSPQPLGGRVIARQLGNLGIDLSERAVRYHLKLMDERGLTHPVGRNDGRLITRSGLEELGSALVEDRVGLVTTKIQMLAYQASFDPKKGTGMVPINVSLFPPKELNPALETMKDAFSAGFGINDLIAVASEGENLGKVIVPPGRTGLATVSRIVVYGSLMRAGIPVDSKFGGILQIQNHEPLRFTELIEYGGCSLDPAEVFIAGKMTSVSKAAKEGNGKILASFCEIPAVARSNAEAIIKDLEMAGMEGVVVLGRVGEPVCQLPVAANRVGMVLADGLNLVATAAEAGIEAVNHAMSGVIDFGHMQHLRNHHPNGR